MDAVVVGDGAPLEVDRRVDRRVLAQRLAHRQREERHVGELHALALLELRLRAVTQPRDPRDVGLEHGRQLSGDLQRLGHPLGDDPPEPRELLGAPAQARVGRARGGRRGGGLLLRRAVLRGRRLLRAPVVALLGRLRAAALRRIEHVLLADAPAHAGAGDLGEVDAVLRGEPPDQGSDVRRPAVVGVVAVVGLLRRRLGGLLLCLVGGVRGALGLLGVRRHLFPLLRRARALALVVALVLRRALRLLLLLLLVVLRGLLLRLGLGGGGLLGLRGLLGRCLLLVSAAVLGRLAAANAVLDHREL